MVAFDLRFAQGMENSAAFHPEPLNQFAKESGAPPVKAELQNPRPLPIALCLLPARFIVQQCVADRFLSHWSFQ